MVFGLAATGGNVKEIKEIEILQGKARRGALDLPRATPKEFLEKEFGASSQTDRVERARIKLLLRMVQRENLGTYCRGVGYEGGLDQGDKE